VKKCGDWLHNCRDFCPVDVLELSKVPQILRSYHYTFLRAKPDGTVDLAQNPKEWEEWTL